MMTLLAVVTAIVALVTITQAQLATYCPQDDSSVCYSVNVPDTAASAGSGDIYFQIQGPSSMQWIGLGQGGAMAGANIFIVYADATGSNVTLSPRLGKGNVQPDFDTQAQVSLLDGSGIANGKMTANVRCTNCQSWNGGNMDLTSSSTSWIWAARSGSPISSSSQSANLRQHDEMDSFQFDLTKARGGSSLNPFVAAPASPSGSGNASSSDTAISAAPTNATSGSGTNYGGSPASKPNHTIIKNAHIAHGTIMGLAFVIFYPLGAIIIRVLSFRTVVWVHAGVQLFSYILVLAGLGLGIYIGVKPSYEINTYHPIIGLIVIGLLFFQPFLGHVHHLIYVRTQKHSIWGSMHVWLGRTLLTLGIINGGLGLRLADNTTGGEIAYGIVAGIAWLAWVGVVLWSEAEKGRARAGRGRRGGEKPLASPPMGRRGSEMGTAL